MNVLFDFIVTESSKYAKRDRNRLFDSLREALRYYDFLLIAAGMYRKNSRKSVSTVRKRSKFIPAQTGAVTPMTEEEIGLMEEENRLNTLAQFAIERFYLFAKIFLDRIALFIEDYFGPARGISLRSHDKWVKNHEQYSSVKNLTYPEGFSQTIDWLKKHISDYRDKQVSHVQRQRIAATTWSTAKPMIRNVAYYIKNAGLSYSEELPELTQAIETYTQQLRALIESNRARTGLELGQYSST